MRKGSAMSNGQAIASLFFCTLAVTFFSLRNSRTESQNEELFKATGELKSPRWLVVLLFAMASFATLMSVMVSHGPRDQTWPMALIGLFGPVYVCVRSFFGLHLDQSGIHFGWQCGRYTAYADVVELERKSDGRNSSFILVLRSGNRLRIGSDLPCEKVFIEELQRRSGCSVSYRQPGGRVTHVP